MEDWAKKIESYKDYPEGSAEKRDYDALKLPEREFALKYYGNEPAGSSFRKIYDYYTLSLEEYITLYFTNTDLTRWKNWYNKFVVPAFVFSERFVYLESLKAMQAPFVPDFDLLDTFYLKIQADSRFDTELQHFFAFIESIGVFKKNHTTFDRWISNKEWKKEPKSPENTKVAITEILQYNHGTDYLKSMLVDVLIKTRP